MSLTTARATVTPAELVVLQVLHELGAGTVAAVHAAMPRTHQVSYNTVLTQVRFLHEKGLVEREPIGRAHVYRPRHDDLEPVLREAVRRFARDYFAGDCEALARFLADSGLLAADAISSAPSTAPAPSTS